MIDIEDDLLRQGVTVPAFELIGDCYYDSAECLPSHSRPDGIAVGTTDDVVLEGSLPYEILGAGYLEEVCPELTMSTVK